MGAPKGHPAYPGAGRPKGSPNKFTVSTKEAYQAAFMGLGGVPALIEWAKKNPTEFYKLQSKLIPHEIAGSDGGPLVITWQAVDWSSKQSSEKP